jgi:hypothetical protein
MRTAVTLALLAAHVWRRVGEIEAQIRAGEAELAERD